MASIFVADLVTSYREIFLQAISSILSTEIAEFTYAQILDGLPTSDVFRDRYSGALRIHHPLRQHTELCPGVLERMRQYRQEFDPCTLRYPSELAEAFQAAPIGTRDFQMRLIEMVAVAVHQIAVLLFQLDESLHKDDGITSWMPEPKRSDSPVPSHLRNLSPPETLFKHPFYSRTSAYPHGIADVVAYWAENRILGGVVLFGRGESGFECNGVYFHSDREDVTFRIYKLLDEQVKDLLDFLLNSSDGRSPLPILGDRRNRDRVDPDEAIDMHNIFRDRWEREVPVRDSAYWRRRRDVQNDLDYPEHADMFEAIQRQFRGSGHTWRAP